MKKENAVAFAAVTPTRSLRPRAPGLFTRDTQPLVAGRTL